ncbi:helix-turn-helix domain-containing protein [Marivita sp. S2033]|uniref:helix-turn-helix domain-containing protein n=1 Tax=Marivita sp. S2033 TaxID=3373187 RepID=UPI00398288AC
MPAPSPSELRNTLGANLRELAKSTESISALCRDLGINRTQFNRYLSGESFPRPDVLFRICQYFNVDARIILEPLEDIAFRTQSLLNHPEISDFLAPGVTQMTELLFPSGFYQFSRRSFSDNTAFLRGLVYVYRKDGATFLRGFEAREAVEHQGLRSDPHTREFRGLVRAAEGGVAIVISRQQALSTSFNFLAQVPSFENNFFVGYAARTAQESPTGTRVARMVCEYLAHDGRKARAAARTAGLCKVEDLAPFHRTQLRVDEPFN